jgi:hypothetical protein
VTFEVGIKEEARYILNNEICIIYIIAYIIKEDKIGRYSKHVEG